MLVGKLTPGERENMFYPCFDPESDIIFLLEVSAINSQLICAV